MANLSNPSAIADKMVQNAAAAGTAYAAGINAVTTAPGQLAAAASQRWLQGVQASLARYQQRVAAVSLQQWQQLAISKGQARLGSGVQAAKQKIQTFWANFAPKLAGIRDQVRAMDASTFESRVSRMVQNATMLHALKGTLT